MIRKFSTSVLVLLALLLSLGCDSGLEPPDVPPLGTIDIQVRYVGDWPSADSLKDLRFVAFTFLPRDTSDFLRLNEAIFSPGLQRNVESQQFYMDSVRTETFVYSGIAQRFSDDLLNWGPVGLYEENGGIFTLLPAETTVVSILVDFDNPPPFPP